MHRSAEELQSGLEHVKASPRDDGRLEAIVIRPEHDARHQLDSCRLDSSDGVTGDRWGRNLPPTPIPGVPGSESQVTLMNARAANLVAGGRDRWALAGDQLYVDLDLSDDNLRAGDRVRIGEVVLEITGKSHLGCRKFAARYGEAALAWVNSPEGKRLHLRGIYARVLTSGEARVGDRIVKLALPSGAES